MALPKIRDIRPYKGNPNLNRSDYFFLYGAQASGILAGGLQIGADVGFFEIYGYGMMGAAMGGVMIMVLLILIGQPPKIYTDIYADLSK